jgi:hypothetical protein
MPTIALPARAAPPRAAPRAAAASLGATADGGAWPYTTRALPWTLALFLVMVWLVPFDAIELPIPMPLDARLDRPLLLLLLGMWALAGAVSSSTLRPRVVITRIHFAVATFVIVAIVGAVLNVGVLINLDEFQLVFKKLALLISFALFFVVVASSVRPAEVPRLVSFSLGLACIAALGTIIELRTKQDFFFTFAKHIPGATVIVPEDLDQPDSIGRQAVYASTGHPLEIATLLGMMLPFAVVRFTGAKTWGPRIRYALVAGLILGGAIATFRKTSIVAPTAGLLVLFAYRPRLMFRRMLPLAVVLFAMIHVLAPGAAGSVLSSLSIGKTSQTNTTVDRASDYDATWPDISQHLIFGRGYGSYDPHKYRILDNEYLGLAIMTGFLGLAAWLLVPLAAMTLAHPVIRGRDPAAATLALALTASVAVLTMALALFDGLGFPHVPYLFFFFCGLIAVLARDQKEREAA